MLIAFTLLIVAASSPQAGPAAEQFLSYGGLGAICESEMAHLDNYAVELQNSPRQTAYVIVYGGRSGTAPHELRQRRARIKRYLVTNRGVEAKRVKVMEGGFREQVTVELWLVEPGGRLPKATPSVSPREVRWRRTREQFTCAVFY